MYIFVRDQLHMDVIMSGLISCIFFQTSVGIVSSPGMENGSIAPMPCWTSFSVVGIQPAMSLEEVCRLLLFGGGNKCVPSMLALSSNIVASLILAILSGDLGKAFGIVFQRFCAEVMSTTLFH